ncbi:metallophosphoesterase family protein [Agromyces sp. M3QZ16-3]|uniref:metallophosphoesterase family protein n=1 Tax=Agromyces sp. M3QZ16-3 TaxID=3447585 RepID=UPI003F69477C
MTMSADEDRSTPEIDPKDHARRVWRQSHGYTGEALVEYAKSLEWLLDDPRYQDPDFEPPQTLTYYLGIVSVIEAEAIRMIQAGPPYEPKMHIEGSFSISQIEAFFPPRWVEFLQRMGLKKSAITPEMLAEWEPLLSNNTPLRDGALLSNHTWSLTDPAWTLVAPSYVARLLDPSITHPFGTDPAWIRIDDADELTLGLTGDWGGGAYFDGEGVVSPPIAIMDKMMELGVDYTVHLGDVYPLGSMQIYPLFLRDWKPGRRGSFNLNSNHDMYAWAKGYFEAGLKHPTFAAQQGTSYFAVEFGDWIIVGLDSAYAAELPLMYDGKIQDEHQRAFLRRVREQSDRTGQKVFVMTHHHALLPEGNEKSSLWDDVVSDHALGRAPDVWYYGHYHAAAVYSEHSAAGPNTKARVMGHGAIPFAPPAELAENAGPGKPIECYAHTPYDDDVPEHRGRAMNGFAHVTLSRDGGIRERFYNQDGSEMCG